MYLINLVKCHNIIMEHALLPEALITIAVKKGVRKEYVYITSVVIFSPPEAGKPAHKFCNHQYAA